MATADDGGAAAHATMAAGVGGGASSGMIFGYCQGQLVEASRDLGVVGQATGEVEVAVREGGRGTVWGAATNGDPARVAVIFDDHLGEVLNVDPEEIRVGDVVFDTSSRSVETHLARLIWDGRDPMANPPPPAEAFQWRLPPGDYPALVPQNHPTGQPGGRGAGLGSPSPARVMDVSPARRVGGGGGTASASITRARAAAYTPRLLAFFERYNPHRLPAVAQLLAEHRGREEELFQTLVARYGPEPHPHHHPAAAAGDLPPGWVQVQSSKGHVFYRHVSGARQWTRPTA